MFPMKSHYEKVIAACCFLFIFANIGLASTAFSVHQPYLVAMPGIGDTGGSLILSVRTLTSLAATMFVDRYYRLLDVRIGVALASGLTCAGFLIYSISTNLPTFFVGAVLLGAGYGLGGLVAMTYLFHQWFESGIGTAMGFATMGSGACSIVMPLIVSRVIEASSLSAAFVVEACVAGAIGLVSLTLIRNRPADLGREPYKGKPGKSRERAARNLPPTSRAERAALLAAMVMVGAYCCGAVTYVSVLATSSGFDHAFAALLVSLTGIALTASKFATGELFDHLGSPRASAIMFALALAGFALACCAGLGSEPIMIIAAIALGAGLSLGSVGVSAWSLELSDPANRARQVRNFQVAYALGGFISNTLPGIVKDLVGTYVVSYAAMGALTLAAAIIILRHYRKHAS